ncbi:MAG: LLM class flavin-dependent oxidoreductase [Alphaproteobacteria bacterium]|nr:LLM class flavin-dependent oxidoreductase [Alphaproteobacteria bacterium]
MRLGIVAAPQPLESATTVAARLSEIGRLVEALDYSGLWITDSLGRGMNSLDPLLLLTAVAPITEKIELGTCVLQVPLRHPVELAHRVMSLDVLSEGRLRLGVGAGSTEADFLAVEADYAGRFKALRKNLEVMRQSWRGEAVFGPAVTPWPGHEQGPPMFLGAWHSPRWVDYAASHCRGWMASGIYSTIEAVAEGVADFRAAGGERVILANVFTDLRPRAVRHPLIERAKINLVCDPGEARERLARIADSGVDDVLLLCPFDDPGQLEQLRELAA